MPREERVRVWEGEGPSPPATPPSIPRPYEIPIPSAQPLPSQEVPSQEGQREPSPRGGAEGRRRRRAVVKVVVGGKGRELALPSGLGRGAEGRLALRRWAEETARAMGMSLGEPAFSHLLREVARGDGVVVVALGPEGLRPLSKAMMDRWLRGLVVRHASGAVDRYGTFLRLLEEVSRRGFAVGVKLPDGREVFFLPAGEEG